MATLSPADVFKMVKKLPLLHQEAVHSSGFQGVFLSSPKVLGQGKLASSTVASQTDNALALYIQI